LISDDAQAVKSSGIKALNRDHCSGDMYPKAVPRIDSHTGDPARVGSKWRQQQSVARAQRVEGDIGIKYSCRTAHAERRGPSPPFQPRERGRSIRVSLSRSVPGAIGAARPARDYAGRGGERP